MIAQAEKVRLVIKNISRSDVENLFVARYDTEWCCGLCTPDTQMTSRLSLAISDQARSAASIRFLLKRARALHT